jgi:hypothetical protein
MFKNLFDFMYQRTVKEAIGFYIAYLLLILISGVILGGTLSGFFVTEDTFEAGYDFGLKLGIIFAVLACLYVSISLVVKKKLYMNFGFVLLSLCAGILALFGGAFLGLIIPAFFTTRQVMIEKTEPIE